MNAPIISGHEEEPPHASLAAARHRRLLAGVLLRVIVSGATLIVILISVDVPAAVHSILDIDLPLFLVAFSLYQAGNLARSIRWKILLDSVDAPLTLLRVLIYNYIGAFFNLLLPTAVGGDAMRILKARGRIGTTTSIATVLVDRILGLVALFCIALAVMPFAALTAERTLLLITTVTSLAGLVAGVLLLDNRWLQYSLAHSLLRRVPGAEKIAAMCRAIGHISRNRAGLMRAALVSVVFNVLFIGVYYVAALALHLALPIQAVVLLVPIISVLALVPSIHGLGVRESAIIVLTAPYAVSGPDALALGVAVYTIMLLTGLLGLLFYLAAD